MSRSRSGLVAVLAGAMLWSASGSAAATECGARCWVAARSCHASGRIDRRACVRGCADAPSLEDQLLCRRTCRADARLDHGACQGALSDCLRECETAPLRAQAASGLYGTGADATVQVQGPAGILEVRRGQTAYLDFVVRNNGAKTVPLRYVPTFTVKGVAGVFVRAVSGRPSSPSTTQNISPRGTKKIRVSVKIQEDARAGTAVIVGTFAFTSPEAGAVEVEGRLFVPGAPELSLTCAPQQIGTKTYRVVVDVRNAGKEALKAVRITPVVTVPSRGASFRVTSGRVPSSVFRLPPGDTARFSFTGAWNRKGRVRLFEAASAVTQLNKKVATANTECAPRLEAP